MSEARRPASATLLVLALHLFGATPATAHADGRHARPGDEGAIGISLVGTPSDRTDDPRARVFIDDHVDPGTTLTRRLRVDSTSRTPQHVTLYAGAAGISGHRFTFAPGATGNELTSWITLDRSRLALKAHAGESVEATIAVPPWATKGERYAVIWAQVSSVARSRKANIALVNRVGIRTYLDVGPGGEPPSDFTIGEVRPQRTRGGQRTVVATVSNTGRRAIDLGGRLFLSAGPGSLRTGPLPVIRGTTLAPGDQGQITVPLGPDLPEGPWTFRLTLRSGRIEHTATGALTFSKKASASGVLPSFVTCLLRPAGTLAGFLTAALILLLVRLRRFRAGTQVPGHRPSRTR
ncbi:peptidase [Actinoallomurus purpureus]|uniref:peptidase n=1 Tax=Actinoallomurus purpureus TaxID=478114 RepID=UPI002093E42C|nr:peptidase [Actinoallomurus purpureus]MCO6006502.1 peptidase [Actinoallomurus purpureus]